MNENCPANTIHEFALILSEFSLNIRNHSKALLINFSGTQQLFELTSLARSFSIIRMGRRKKAIELVLNTWFD